MAFDLRAILRLDDKFSKPLSRIEKAAQRTKKVTDQLRDSNGRLRDSMGRFSKESDRAANSLGGFSGKASGALRGLGGLQTAFLGIASAIGGATAAHKIFDSTIGEAAKYEQSLVMIEAMFDDEKAAKAYTEMLNKFAIDSPIMDSQTMFANSKSFITASKDIKELEMMWSLTERLAATDPAQGLEGAVFALRELFSGDAISLQRRFEMGGKDIDRIKDLNVPEQLKELDKYFTKIGLSQKLIDKMGGTTLGIFQQIKETVSVAFRNLGQPALQSVKALLSDTLGGLKSVDEIMKLKGKIDPYEFRKMLDKALRIERFKETGAKILKNIVDGLIEGGQSIANWIQSIQNNPSFREQTTIFGKVKWVIDDIFTKFNEWLDGGGRDKIEKIAAGLIQILTAAIEASIENILPIAIKVGGALGQGIVDGFNESIKDSWLLQLISGGVKGSSDGGKTAKGLAQDFLYNKGVDMFKDFVKGKSHSAGLSRVPYNGYQATLHKDETVLNRAEAQEYRTTKGNNSGVVITGNTFNVRKDSDIKAIAYELAKLIEQEGGQMA
jgi:hypothetical protein